MTTAGDLLVGLEPVWSPDARILLLGSLPGNRSLAVRQYYAHPRNQFWQLVGGVLGIELGLLPYHDRLRCLMDRKIALWDVVATGRRQGSLDAALHVADRTDLAGLVAQLPRLATIGFNGKLAAKLGRTASLPPYLRLLDLPSSSAANTTPFATKLMEWQAIAV